MIHAVKTVTVGDFESIIDSPIVLYRGDREVEIQFTILKNSYTFNDENNLIKSSNASHGQLVLNTPSGENMFSEVSKCYDGNVVFVVTKDMIDELQEVGFYSFQIRLYDSSQTSRITIPPVFKGFDIRNPIAAEDETNVVDQGMVDYARIFKNQSNEELPTFDWKGNYNKTEWVHHDTITENKMNKIEDALYSINANVRESDVVMLNTLDQVKKDADMYVKEHMAEVEADVEEFERTLNTDVQKFKIDTNTAMTAHKNEVSEELAQKVNYITPEMYKDINTEDDTDSIIEAIKQANNGQKIIFSGNYIIDKTITLDKNVVLDFTGASVSSNTSSTMFNISNGDIKIIGLSVDLKNTLSKIIFDIDNSNHTNITNCCFKNFKETNPDIQLVVIRIKSGSNVTLDNIKFENIVNVGNGVIKDHGGASRLILTYGEQYDKRYNINIDNIYINNIKSINSQGTEIKEDTDSIVTQHVDLLAHINISNIVANNFGKRILKLQGGNVNVNNIQGSNTTGLSTDGFIYVNNSNINISNVRYHSNCDTVGISIADCNKCNINNVIIDNANGNISIENDLDASILCINSHDVNISNFYANGFSRGITLYDCTGVNLRDSKIIGKYRIAVFYCRTLSNYNAPNCKIKDILLSNCKFIVTDRYTQPFLELRGFHDTSELNNIIIENSMIDFQDRGYQYGYVRCFNVTDFIMKNTTIKFNTDIENTSILNFQGSTVTEIYKTKINSSNDINGTKDISFDGSSKGYIEKSGIKEILIASNATVEIDKTECNVTLTSGATSSSYKVYSHYVKQ